MASIWSNIELQDQFSGVLSHVINSVSLAISYMGDMQQAMNANIDTRPLEGARQEIDSVAQSLLKMNEEMQSIQPAAMPSFKQVPQNVLEPLTVPNPVSQPQLSPESAPLPASLPAPMTTPLPAPIPAPLPASQPVPQPAPQSIPQPQPAPQSIPQPQPTPEPIQWQTDTMPVFDGAGMERYKQEISNANSMLMQLSNTQTSIAQQAAYTDILPQEAISDMSSMATRIDQIRDKIDQISSNPLYMGTDAANAQLEQLRGQLNQSVTAQNALNRAVDNMDVPAANAAYQQLSHTVAGTEKYIRDNITAQNGFNDSVSQGTSKAKSLVDTIKSAVLAYASIQSVIGVAKISDEFSQTVSRLDLMNDKLQSTDELVDMIYGAAQSARAPFDNMAAVVARLGNNAGDAFSNTGQIVAFAELVRKQMKIAGTSASEAANSMLQLSQALGSGVLRGDELNSIFEQAPNLVQNIADYLDVPIGKIKDMAAEGELTSDIIVAAVFAASGDINDAFKNMPMTWGDVLTNMQNTARQAFQPVLQQINAIANSQDFQTFANQVMGSMFVVADFISKIFDLIGSVGSAIMDNWSAIAPVIIGAAMVLALYAANLAIVNGIEMISKGIKIAGIIATYAMAAAKRKEVEATTAQTAAQYGLNTALLASPVTWILVVIIAIIAAVYGVVAALNYFVGTSISATGVIFGAFAWLGSVIANIFMGLLELLFGFIERLVNPFIQLANFIGNVFNNPVSSIIYLFQGMADGVLGTLESIASALDFVFGSNMADAVAGWRSGLKDMADAAVAKYAPNENYQKVINELDLSVEGTLGWKRFDNTDAYNAGYETGQNLEATLAKGFDFDPASLAAQQGQEYDKTSENIAAIAEDTGSIRDGMEITEEDLKYLRDIAERDVINRFTTAEISITQNNTNNISSDLDLDGIVDDMRDGLQETANIAIEGSY
jgi:tape measure domain-containing protein